MKQLLIACAAVVFSAPSVADDAIAPYLPSDGCISRAMTPPCDNSSRNEPSKVPHQVVHGDFLVTSPGSDAEAPFLPHFYVGTHYRYHGFAGPMESDGSPKSYMRGGLILVDKGDSAELAFHTYRRDEQGAPFYSPDLGRIYLQTYTLGCGKAGYYDPCQGYATRNRPVEILLRDVGNREGMLDFRVAPHDHPGDPVRTMEVVAAQAGDAPYNIWIIDHQGNRVRRTVELGGTDSCGAGYECLRIRNR